MGIDIPLVWLAFGLVYFQEHFKNIWQTLQPNPFSCRRWEAVMRGTFTKKTAFPLAVLFLLTIAIFLINDWQQTNWEDRIDELQEQNAKILELLEAQNVTGNTTSE